MYFWPAWANTAGAARGRAGRSHVCHLRFSKVRSLRGKPCTPGENTIRTSNWFKKNTCLCKLHRPPLKSTPTLPHIPTISDTTTSPARPAPGPFISVRNGAGRGLLYDEQARAADRDYIIRDDLDRDRDAFSWIHPYISGTYPIRYSMISYISWISGTFMVYLTSPELFLGPPKRRF